MPLKINLVSKKPILFGDNNNFMTLGQLEARGDKFIVFMDLRTGKVYIEESFATQALGQFLAGLKQVDDDTLWAQLSDAANKYGLSMVRHMADNMKEAGVKIDKTVAKALGKVAEDWQHIKGLGIIK